MLSFFFFPPFQYINPPKVFPSTRHHQLKSLCLTSPLMVFGRHVHFTIDNAHSYQDPYSRNANSDITVKKKLYVPVNNNFLMTISSF